MQDPSSDKLHRDFEENEESSVIITQLTKKRKTEISIEERQQKLLLQFLTICSSPTSHQKLDAIEKVLYSLPPTLAAIDNMKEHNFPSTSKNISHNEKIIPQRKFVSTKKKQKKNFEHKKTHF